MKICWENLEKLRYNNKTNKWYKKTATYVYKKSCEGCKESFLSSTASAGIYCCKECQMKNGNPSKRPEIKKKMGETMKGKNNPMYGKKHTEEVKKKISRAISGENHPMYGKKFTEEHKRKISFSHKGEKSSAWKGGYASKNIPTYNEYANQIVWCEPVRRNQEDPNILEIKCTWCGKWFIPKQYNVRNRIQSLNGNDNYPGENRFYCSDGCKQNCPIWNKSPEQLMKEDAVKAGRLTWLELNREVQPQLRQMVFKRDGWKCTKCESTESLHCHHVEGIRWEPLQSSDIDMCITVCKECHKEIHQKDGCKYNELKCLDV